MNDSLVFCFHNIVSPGLRVFLMLNTKQVLLAAQRHSVLKNRKIESKIIRHGILKSEIRNLHQSGDNYDFLNYLNKNRT